VDHYQIAILLIWKTWVQAQVEPKLYPMTIILLGWLTTAPATHKVDPKLYPMTVILLG